MPTLEINASFREAQTEFGIPGGPKIIITPPLGGDYWLARVPVSEKQAVVCFPKFCTIGIGFQYEEDWNTNFPYTTSAEEIFAHIAHNKGDDSIQDQACIDAIKVLQAFVKANAFTLGV